jgi:signal transduction histidine kinase
MIRDWFPSLAKGIDKLRENPQLWYTIFVAIMILVAFIFVANRFVTIAQDAQERLLEERMGAFQDSFVQFSPEYVLDESRASELKHIINRIAIINPTVNEFKVLRFDNEGVTVISSLNSGEIGQIDNSTDNNFLYNLAKTNPNQTYLAKQSTEVERFNVATRVITDDFGNPIGAVLIKQSLTEADIKIGESIQNSVIVFIAIVVLIMFLFFRHARIIDYTALYKKLRDVDQLKDDFISMASHELRTPLTVIRGYAENLGEAGPMNEQQTLSADRIEIAARQLDELVNDMLDVSRIEQGRLKMELSQLNPVTAISDVVSGFVSVAKDKGLELNFSHALQTNQKIKVDPNRFRQVMVNIIGNAIKYTKEGEVRVRVENESTGGKNKISIRVSDTGIGMSAEDQEKLFEKFYRIKSDETREIRGTGLGLWITKQIVEQMGGKISVESIKGVGTHFIVTFDVVG